MARYFFGDFKYKLRKSASAFSGRILIREKLNNWLGYLLLSVVACLYAFMLAKDLMIGLSLFGILVGLFIVIICLTHVEAGFYLLLFLSFFSYFISSFFFRGHMPVGVVFDTMVGVNFLGLVLSRKDFKQSWKKFTRIPLVLCMLLTFFYSVLEMFNPNSMGASATNLQGVRKFLEFVFILFIAYMLFGSHNKIRRYTFCLLFFATICAIYGCIQEWHGLFSWELNQIMADPHAFGLLFAGGEFRKYSTMSDPSIFGIIMAVCSVFFMILSVYEENRRIKLTFILCSIFMILGMGYSGTRTAYATVMAGIGFFLLFNIEKPAIRKFGAFFFVIFLALLFGPFSNIATIRRFRSTFTGSSDESYKVRQMSRAIIQPYIRSHPIGGGMGTTGFNGAIEHPGHPLANFQPDGSYVTIAAETGYIGLAIVCFFYFFVLKVGIQGYFHAKDEKTKAYYSACVSSLFAFYIAEFAQVAIGGVSDLTVYFAFIAIILNLKSYDRDDSHQTLLV